MRIIDFLQLISDLDKQTLFYYEDKNDNRFALTNIVQTDFEVILITKKAEQHALHQWELVTLLNQIKNKNIFLKVRIENEDKNIFGIQLHKRFANLK